MTVDVCKGPLVSGDESEHELQNLLSGVFQIAEFGEVVLTLKQQTEEISRVKLRKATGLQ